MTKTPDYTFEIIISNEVRAKPKTQVLEHVIRQGYMKLRETEEREIRFAWVASNRNNPLSFVYCAVMEKTVALAH